MIVHLYKNNRLYIIVEVEFYNFEFWAANNLQNQDKGRKSPLGHWGGADQGCSDDQVSVCSYNQYNDKNCAKVNNWNTTELERVREV